MTNKDVIKFFNVSISEIFFFFLIVVVVCLLGIIWTWNLSAEGKEVLCCSVADCVCFIDRQKRMENMFCFVKGFFLEVSKDFGVPARYFVEFLKNLIL